MNMYALLEVATDFSPQCQGSHKQNYTGRSHPRVLPLAKLDSREKLEAFLDEDSESRRQSRQLP